MSTNTTMHARIEALRHRMHKLRNAARIFAFQLYAADARRVPGAAIPPRPASRA